MMGIETSGEEAEQLFATVDTNRSKHFHRFDVHEDNFHRFDVHDDDDDDNFVHDENYHRIDIAGTGKLVFKSSLITSEADHIRSRDCQCIVILSAC